MKYSGLCILFIFAICGADPAIADHKDGYKGKSDSYHLYRNDRSYNSDSRHYNRLDRDGYRHDREYNRRDQRHYRKYRHRRHYQNRHRQHYRNQYHRYYFHYYNPYRSRYYSGHGRRHFVHIDYDDDYYKWIAGAIVATELIHHALPADRGRYEDHEETYRRYYYREYHAD